MTPQERFEALADKLPVTSGSKGIYKSCVTAGTLVYTSGHVPFDQHGNRIKGRVGAGMDTQEAKLP